MTPVYVSAADQCDCCSAMYGTENNIMFDVLGNGTPFTTVCLKCRSNYPALIGPGYKLTDIDGGLYWKGLTDDEISAEIAAAEGGLQAPGAFDGDRAGSSAMVDRGGLDGNG